MLIVVANIFVKEGKAEEFIERAGDCINKTRLEDGNILYSLLVDSEDPCKMSFLEKWADKASLNKHMEQGHFKNLGDVIMELAAKPLDIEVFEAGKI
ncbi:MAG: antibiotic biosynthesis monooxygenase [Clostridiales bacterium]|jgi:quinol monooxygenase YgiN|nr:antibiotic biosynthesis monooxygenase [Clostridiales bacterium]